MDKRNIQKITVVCGMSLERDLKLLYAIMMRER